MFHNKFITLVALNILFWSLFIRVMDKSSTECIDPLSDLDARLQRYEAVWQRSLLHRREMIDQTEALARLEETHGGDFGPAFPQRLFPYGTFDYVRSSFGCPHTLERIGGLADGGKWVCGMESYEKSSHRPLIIYSFGVAHDASFEQAMLERTNAEIWGFDHSVTRWPSGYIKPKHRKRAHFTQAAIGPQTIDTENVLSVQDIMRKNNHDFIDIMKIDIEGMEFDALTSFARSSLTQRRAGEGVVSLPVGQLLIEVHLVSYQNVSIPATLQSWIQWWERLEAMGMRPVHDEDNWTDRRLSGVPNYMEYTMINVLNCNNSLLH